jgi:hypothetical protein
MREKLGHTRTQGNLLIPHDATIINFSDLEFGVKATIKKNDLPLYGKPPTTSLSKKTVQELKKKGQFPVLSKEGIFAAQLLSKNQEVLVRKPDFTDGHVYEGIWEVTTFEHVGEKDDKPESGNEIKIKYAGYGFKQDFTIQKREIFKKFTGDIFPDAEKKEEIRASHIQQRSMGDCFLLASILAILNFNQDLTHGEIDGIDFIRGMMKQDGDHTIVRFFDPNTNPPTPVYIRVENSFYDFFGSGTVQHLYPWVHILEKAYAAFARRKDKWGNFYRSYPSFHDLCNGGNADVALSILTGKPAKQQPIKGREISVDREMLATQMFYLQLPNIFSGILSSEQINQLIQSTILLEKGDFQKLEELKEEFDQNKDNKDAQRKILLQCLEPLKLPADFFENKIEVTNSQASESEASISEASESEAPESETVEKAFGDYLNFLFEPLDNFYLPDSIFPSIFPKAQIISLGKYIFELYQWRNEAVFSEEASSKSSQELNENSPDVMPKVEVFTSLLQSVLEQKTVEEALLKLSELKQFQPEVPRELIDTLQKHVVYTKQNDARTQYSVEQNEIYEDIKNKIDAGFLLTASTLQDFSKIPASERIGLYDTHAYQIVGVIEVGQGEHKRKCIKLRNPWGNSIRTYDWFNEEQIIAKGENVAKETEAPEGFVELSDFTKLFRCYVVCEPLISLQKQENEQAESSNYFEQTVKETEKEKEETEKEKEESAETKKEKVKLREEKQEAEWVFTQEHLHYDFSEQLHSIEEKANFKRALLDIADSMLEKFELCSNLTHEAAHIRFADETEVDFSDTKRLDTGETQVTYIISPSQLQVCRDGIRYKVHQDPGISLAVTIVTTPSSSADQKPVMNIQEFKVIANSPKVSQILPNIYSEAKHRENALNFIMTDLKKKLDELMVSTLSESRLIATYNEILPGLADVEYLRAFVSTQEADQEKKAKVNKYIEYLREKKYKFPEEVTSEEKIFFTMYEEWSLINTNINEIPASSLNGKNAGEIILRQAITTLETQTARLKNSYDQLKEKNDTKGKLIESVYKISEEANEKAKKCLRMRYVEDYFGKDNKLRQCIDNYLGLEISHVNGSKNYLNSINIQHDKWKHGAFPDPDKNNLRLIVRDFINGNSTEQEFCFRINRQMKITNPLGTSFWGKLAATALAIIGPTDLRMVPTRVRNIWSVAHLKDLRQHCIDVYAAHYVRLYEEGNKNHQDAVTRILTITGYVDTHQVNGQLLCQTVSGSISDNTHGFFAKSRQTTSEEVVRTKIEKMARDKIEQFSPKRSLA